MQVISAGYSRTGTVSMSMALDKLLDGSILHGGTQILVRDDGEIFHAAFSTILRAITQSPRSLFAWEDNQAAM